MEGRNKSRTNKKCSSRTRYVCYYQNEQYPAYPALLPAPFPLLPQTGSLQLTTAIPPVLSHSHTHVSKAYLPEGSCRQMSHCAAPSETHVLVFPATKASEGIQQLTSSTMKTDYRGMAAAALDHHQNVDGNQETMSAIQRPDSGGINDPLIPLLANHFLVQFDPSQRIFHYDVDISPRPSKDIARLIKRKLVEDNPDVFAGARAAFDGQKNLYSPVEFEDNRLEFYIKLPIPAVKPVNLGDNGTLPKQTHKLFRVNVRLVSKLDGKDLQNYLSKDGDSAPLPQDYLHALDVVLRESPSEKCIPVGRSLYSSSMGGIKDIGGGVVGLRGFFQSLRPTQQGLALNVDFSVSAFHESIGIIQYLQKRCDFLRNLSQRKTRGLVGEERMEVEKALKNIRVFVCHRDTDQRYRVYSLTNEATENLRFRDRDGKDLKLVDYFKDHYNHDIQFRKLPCLQISRSKPCYLPMELCVVCEGQKFFGKLSNDQTARILKMGCQRPRERKAIIDGVIGGTVGPTSIFAFFKLENEHMQIEEGGVNRFYKSPQLVSIFADTIAWDLYVLFPSVMNLRIVGIVSYRAVVYSVCHVSCWSSGHLATEFNLHISREMTHLYGRVLQPPKLKLGDGGQVTNLVPTRHDRQWNLIDSHVFEGTRIERWALISFGGSAEQRCWIPKFVNQLTHRCEQLGIFLSKNTVVCPHFEQIQVLNNISVLESKLRKIHESASSKLQLLICVMEKKHKGYADLKRIAETSVGFVSQCCLYSNLAKLSSQFLANLALKINAKVGGCTVALYNSFPHQIPRLFRDDEPVIFMGADVTHPHPLDDFSPSVAAVVGSMNWPASNKYISRMRSQIHRKEIIQDLSEMVGELLDDFFQGVQKLPKRILFFRDGVSETQFHKVLQEELQAIRAACSRFPDYNPTITFAVVQKRHHTRLFPNEATVPAGLSSNDNIPPGTVVDTVITHPKEFDFYLCSHWGMKGTSRPTHYHVLWDENHFTSDEFQKLVHNLCYTFVRCTKPVSLVPPAYYAHLAAYRGRLYLERSDSAALSRNTLFRAAPPLHAAPLPKLNDNVKKLMSNLGYTDGRQKIFTELQKANLEDSSKEGSFDLLASDTL
ncbi:Protein argonaute 7 [Asimina triloba]